MKCYKCGKDACYYNIYYNNQNKMKLIEGRCSEHMMMSYADKRRHNGKVKGKKT